MWEMKSWGSKGKFMKVSLKSRILGKDGRKQVMCEGVWHLFTEGMQKHGAIRKDFAGGKMLELILKKGVGISLEKEMAYMRQRGRGKLAIFREFLAVLFCTILSFIYPSFQPG